MRRVHRPDQARRMPFFKDLAPVFDMPAQGIDQKAVNIPAT